MATEIGPRDVLEPFPGQRFPWQTPPAAAANARMLGWATCARWPWAHIVMEGDDRRPYFLCRGHGSYYFGKIDPAPERKCGLCREWEQRNVGS